MDKEEIEAVRVRAIVVRNAAITFGGVEQIDLAKAVADDLDHLTTRLSEVERERDEARAEVPDEWVDVAKCIQRERDQARADLATLRATVDRLTDGMDEAAFTDWKERAIRSMQAASDAAGVICCDLVPEAIATLRAAIAEAMRRADGMSWPDKFGALEAVEPLRNLTKPDTPSERIMSDKDRENPVEGAHPTQPEADPLVEALEWYGEQARLARLIHSEGDAGRHALQDDGGKRARKALASRGLVRGEGVER